MFQSASGSLLNFGAFAETSQIYVRSIKIAHRIPLVRFMELFYRAREKYEIIHLVLRRSCAPLVSIRLQCQELPIRFIKSAEHAICQNFHE